MDEIKAEFGLDGVSPYRVENCVGETPTDASGTLALP